MDNSSERADKATLSSAAIITLPPPVAPEEGGVGGVDPTGGTGGVDPTGGTGGVDPTGGTGGVDPVGGTAQV